MRELGLDEGDVRYAGMNAYVPGNPMLDTRYRDRFALRTSYWKVAEFYLRHPGKAVDILRSDLRIEAPQRRLYSNFPKSYGRPPYAQTERFGSWSGLRIWLFHLWPGHIVVWYALVILGAVLRLIDEKLPMGSALLWTTLAVAMAGVGEFCVASLADGGETARHLWMFHVFTDATIFLALVFAMSRRGVTEIWYAPR
jgi:hypothetical protein